MFKNIKDNLIIKDVELLSKLGFDIDEDMPYVFSSSIDPKLFYFDSIRNNDLESVKLLIYSNAIDVNYRFRMNKVSRSKGDLIALKEAITSYSFDVAEFLVEAGHNTDEFTIYLHSTDRDNLYYESFKQAKQFCEDHNIQYEEVE